MTQNAQQRLVDKSALELVEFQKKLSIIAVEVPDDARADVLVDGERWRYIQHGAGVNFIRYKDGLVVDMETDVGEPSKISAWRLSLYLESKNLHFEETLVKGFLSSSKVMRREGHYFRPIG